jgi:hypothetical protein
MQALQNSLAAHNSCFKVGGAGVAEFRSSKMSVHGSTTSRICAAGVGRFRLGSRADRSLGCANARPRKISSSVESRAVSVNASTKKGESSEASPGNSPLVELAGDELEVGSGDGVSQTGAETSEFHVDRSRIPGWSPRALLLFFFLFGPCRCPMIIGGYPVYDSELVSLNPPGLFSSIRSSPE